MSTQDVVTHGRIRSHADQAGPSLARPDDASRPRVIVADGDPLARRVVRDVLQDSETFVVAAEARNGVEAVELALHYRPELVLMDPTLPGLDGVAATQRIVAAAPEVSVVLFAVTSDVELEMRSLRAGARGFLSKELSMDSVVQALGAVLRGEPAVSRSLTMSLIEQVRSLPEAGTGLRPVTSVLTTREWQVLDLLSSGATTADMAATLVLTEDTIYSHVKNIMRKLGVHSRAEAVSVAQRMCQVGG